jgi:hypothetical protein
MHRPLNRKAIVKGKPGRELTTQARRNLWTQLRKMPWVLLIVLVGAAAIIVFFGIIPWLTPIPGFIRGLIAGLGVTSLVAGIGWILLVSDALMSCRVGAFGEQWTSAELRNLGRGWTILNNVRVPAANGEPREVDHIAVGPGGVLVLDSKFWPSREHQLDTSASPYIDGAAKGACQQAGVVRWFLSDCVPGEIVRPTVIFWGSRLSSPRDYPVFTKRSGVQLVHGRDSSTWLQNATAVVELDPPTIGTVLSKLEPHMVPKQRLRDIRPPSDWTLPFSN